MRAGQRALRMVEAGGRRGAEHGLGAVRANAKRKPATGRARYRAFAARAESRPRGIRGRACARRSKVVPRKHSSPVLVRRKSLRGREFFLRDSPKGKEAIP